MIRNNGENTMCVLIELYTRNDKTTLLFENLNIEPVILVYVTFFGVFCVIYWINIIFLGIINLLTSFSSGFDFFELRIGSLQAKKCKTATMYENASFGAIETLIMNKVTKHNEFPYPTLYESHHFS